MSSTPPSAAPLIASLRANLCAVRDRLDAAARSVGREPSEVQLLPVTKSVPPRIALALADVLDEGRRGSAGAPAPIEFAENRPGSLEAKRAAFAEAGRPVRWHFIGHLQRNKARRVVRAVEVLHSVDSLRLAETLARVCAEEERQLDVYLQVNCTGEEQKHGLDPTHLGEVAALVADAPTLTLRGLMAMGPLVERPGWTTPEVFTRVAALARKLEDEGDVPLAGGRCALSLGMSADLEAAVAAGSTCVRIGSDLFRGLDPGAAA